MPLRHFAWFDRAQGGVHRVGGGLTRLGPRGAPPPRPAHKAIIDRSRRTILGRAIAPATATFQHLHDAADDAAIVRPLDAPYIRRQVRFDPIPLLIAQPKQVPAHDPDPLPKTNQNRIVRPEKLMSSDPSHVA